MSTTDHKGCKILLRAEGQNLWEVFEREGAGESQVRRKQLVCLYLLKQFRSFFTEPEFCHSQIR